MSVSTASGQSSASARTAHRPGPESARTGGSTPRTSSAQLGGTRAEVSRASLTSAIATPWAGRDQPLGHAQAHPERYKASLRAVMQIPLKPPEIRADAVLPRPLSSRLALHPPGEFSVSAKPRNTTNLRERRCAQPGSDREETEPLHARYLSRVPSGHQNRRVGEQPDASFRPWFHRTAVTRPATPRHSRPTVVSWAARYGHRRSDQRAAHAAVHSSPAPVASQRRGVSSPMTTTTGSSCRRS